MHGKLVENLKNYDRKSLQLRREEHPDTHLQIHYPTLFITPTFTAVYHTFSHPWQAPVKQA
jgi:hypothetical protein